MMPSADCEDEAFGEPVHVSCYAPRLCSGTGSGEERYLSSVPREAYYKGSYPLVAVDLLMPGL